MKTQRTNNKKGWIGTLDRAPFDETFHDLESFDEGFEVELEYNESVTIFWAACDDTC
jgi:hypothetical protein